jgi:hypothetical protein
MVSRRIQDTDAAAAGNLEQNVGLIDAELLIGDGAALGRVGEVVRVAHDHVHAWIDHFRAVLVPGDVAVHRWDGQAADRADGVMAEQLGHLRFPVDFHLAGNRAHQAARLLLFEEERRNVGSGASAETVAFGINGTSIDDGKTLVRELLGDLG